MGSETSRTDYGSDAATLDHAGTARADGSGWHGLERRVLLTKLRTLEERARRLEYVETRLRDLAHEVQRLNRLADATQSLHAATTTCQLLETALAKALELLRAQAASVCLCEPDGEELTVARAVGPGGAALEGQRQPVGRGVAGYVAARREPVRVAEVATDGRFPQRASERYATGSFLSVPVLTGEGVLGVLNVSDRRDGQAFSEEDLRTALRLAQDVASALERVRRTEASEEQHHLLVRKLAHELRNPLDGVLRFINLTLADGHPEAKRRRFLMASKQGLERMTGIVRSLSNSWRHAGPSDEPGEVNDLIRQAVQLQEGKAHQRGVDVALSLDESVPAVPGGGALFQVFTNLISNALDAMEESGGRLAIASGRENGSVVVRVSDTGGGMPPELVEQIFAPFFTTKGSGKGMGLGLAVCQEVVGRLNGQIDVSSEPGSGTTFTIEVPCSTADARART
ncbi:MAG: sensor histidine kinase [bacterium]